MMGGRFGGYFGVPLEAVWATALREAIVFHGVVKAGSGAGDSSFYIADSLQSHLTVALYPITCVSRIVNGGNGVCSSGRVISYVGAMLGDKRHTMAFACFQAHECPIMRSSCMARSG